MKILIFNTQAQFIAFLKMYKKDKKTKVPKKTNKKVMVAFQLQANLDQVEPDLPQPQAPTVDQFQIIKNQHIKTEVQIKSLPKNQQKEEIKIPTIEQKLAVKEKNQINKIEVQQNEDVILELSKKEQSSGSIIMKKQEDDNLKQHIFQQQASASGFDQPERQSPSTQHNQKITKPQQQHQDLQINNTQPQLQFQTEVVNLAAKDNKKSKTKPKLSKKEAVKKSNKTNNNNVTISIKSDFIMQQQQISDVRQLQVENNLAKVIQEIDQVQNEVVVAVQIPSQVEQQCSNNNKEGFYDNQKKETISENQMNQQEVFEHQQERQTLALTIQHHQTRQQTIVQPEIIQISPRIIEQSYPIHHRKSSQSQPRRHQDVESTKDDDIGQLLIIEKVVLVDKAVVMKKKKKAKADSKITKSNLNDINNKNNFISMFQDEQINEQQSQTPNNRHPIIDNPGQITLNNRQTIIKQQHKQQQIQLYNNNKHMEMRNEINEEEMSMFGIKKEQRQIIVDQNKKEQVSYNRIYQPLQSIAQSIVQQRQHHHQSHSEQKEPQQKIIQNQNKEHMHNNKKYIQQQPQPQFIITNQLVNFNQPALMANKNLKKTKKKTAQHPKSKISKNNNDKLPFLQMQLQLDVDVDIPKQQEIDILRQIPRQKREVNVEIVQPKGQERSKQFQLQFVRQDINSKIDECYKQEEKQVSVSEHNITIYNNQAKPSQHHNHHNPPAEKQQQNIPIAQHIQPSYHPEIPIATQQIKAQVQKNQLPQQQQQQQQFIIGTMNTMNVIKPTKKKQKVKKKGKVVVQSAILEKGLQFVIDQEQQIITKENVNKEKQNAQNSVRQQQQQMIKMKQQQIDNHITKDHPIYNQKHSQSITVATQNTQTAILQIQQQQKNSISHQHFKQRQQDNYKQVKNQSQIINATIIEDILIYNTTTNIVNPVQADRLKKNEPLENENDIQEIISFPLQMSLKIQPVKKVKKVEKGKNKKKEVSQKDNKKNTFSNSLVMFEQEMEIAQQMMPKKIIMQKQPINIKETTQVIIRDQPKKQQPSQKAQIQPTAITEPYSSFHIPSIINVQPKQTYLPIIHENIINQESAAKTANNNTLDRQESQMPAGAVNESSDPLKHFNKYESKQEQQEEQILNLNWSSSLKQGGGKEQKAKGNKVVKKGDKNRDKTVKKEKERVNNNNNLSNITLSFQDRQQVISLKDKHDKAEDHTQKHTHIIQTDLIPKVQNIQQNHNQYTNTLLTNEQNQTKAQSKIQSSTNVNTIANSKETTFNNNKTQLHPQLTLLPLQSSNQNIIKDSSRKHMMKELINLVRFHNDEQTKLMRQRMGMLQEDILSRTIRTNTMKMERVPLRCNYESIIEQNLRLKGQCHLLNSQP